MEKFCEFCDSKGVRHKKDCSRPQEMQALKEEVKPEVTEYHIHKVDGGEYIRTYSAKVHGENAKELAEEFITKGNYLIK